LGTIEALVASYADPDRSPHRRSFVDRFHEIKAAMVEWDKDREQAKVQVRLRSA